MLKIYIKKPLFLPTVFFLQAISKMQIKFKDKARPDEKAQHTWERENF